MRVKLIVAYEGTNYCGWQVQPNGLSVEEVLNRELSRLLGEDIRVIGASRTDSGVHALGNVAVFDTSAAMPADKISFALNRSLPEDIAVQYSGEVPQMFHPRYAPSVKTYEYKIVNCTFPKPLERRTAYFYHYPLDTEKMRQAAAYLVGEHDFTSFASVHAQTRTFVRRIRGIDITEDGCGRIAIRVVGDGFLYNMVRIIAGTLIRVGAGQIEDPAEVQRILEKKDRSQAGPTAPAHGLTLVEIAYLEEGKNKKSPESCDFV